MNRTTLTLIATLLATKTTAHAQTQMTVGPAPAGPPKSVAAAAIKDADHPCGIVSSATRLDSGGIRAVCSNGEAYRIFTVQGRVVAMRCSAAARIGVSGC